MAVVYLETENKGWLSSYHIVRITQLPNQDGWKAYYHGDANDVVSATVSLEAMKEYWIRIGMHKDPGV